MTGKHWDSFMFSTLLLSTISLGYHWRIHSPSKSDSNMKPNGYNWSYPNLKYFTSGCHTCHSSFLLLFFSYVWDCPISDVSKLKLSLENNNITFEASGKVTDRFLKHFPRMPSVTVVLQCLWSVNACFLNFIFENWWSPVLLL